MSYNDKVVIEILRVNFSWDHWLDQPHEGEKKAINAGRRVLRVSAYRERIHFVSISFKKIFKIVKELRDSKNTWGVE